MTYPLYTSMALRRDVPDQGLRRGDVVHLVEHLKNADGEEGYFIEVLNALGKSVVWTTVEASALQPLRANEVLSVRHRKPAKRKRR